MSKIKTFIFMAFSPWVLLGLFASSAALAEKGMTDRMTSPTEPGVVLNMPETGKNRSMASYGDDMSMMRKKRYRFRKRRHRVQILIPTNWVWHQDNQRNKSLNINLLYGYNAGYFEVGPNIQIYNEGGSTDALSRTIRVGLGVWGEFNFQKNVRKKRVIPALGLKLNYLWEQQRHNVRVLPYLSLKYFVASRTGLVFNIEMDIFGRLPRFRPTQFGIGYSVYYVHYFN